MPHIEGESLRARLAHEHELPVGETVRILRDVVDALAYAHAHDIVHRDLIRSAYDGRGAAAHLGGTVVTAATIVAGAT